MRNAAQHREVVGVFGDEAQLDQAVQALEIADFDRRSISVLADEEDMKKAFGATEISTRVLTQSPSTPRKAYLPLEDVNIGTGAIITVGMLAGLMVAVVLTAVAGSAPPGLDALVVGIIAGVGVGAALAWHFRNRRQQHLLQQIDHGGLPLWVRTPSKKQERKAREILRNHGASAVQTQKS